MATHTCFNCVLATNCHHENQNLGFPHPDNVDLQMACIGLCQRCLSYEYPAFCFTRRVCRTPLYTDSCSLSSGRLLGQKFKLNRKRHFRLSVANRYAQKYFNVGWRRTAVFRHWN